jgi:hypothetical protein
MLLVGHSEIADLVSGGWRLHPLLSNISQARCCAVFFGETDGLSPRRRLSPDELIDTPAQ